MSTLAHVFEAAGLSTVVITPMRFIAEKMKTPRSLHAEFPLGLPLGKPRDAQFQRNVLRAALVCSLPPRYDPNLHPAIDEAQALRAAYDRAAKTNGRTSVGRVITADQIPAMLEKLVKFAGGEPWGQQGFEAPLMFVVHDIRTYYEELAFELADGPFEAWGAERWFYDKTEAGKVILEARRTMKDKGATHPEWFYLAPAARE